MLYLYLAPPLALSIGDVHLLALLHIPSVVKSSQNRHSSINPYQGMGQTLIVDSRRVSPTVERAQQPFKWA